MKKYTGSYICVTSRDNVPFVAVSVRALQTADAHQKERKKSRRPKNSRITSSFMCLCRFYRHHLRQIYVLHMSLNKSAICVYLHCLHPVVYWSYLAVNTTINKKKPIKLLTLVSVNGCYMFRSIYWTIFRKSFQIRLRYSTALIRINISATLHSHTVHATIRELQEFFYFLILFRN
jgi:hypothetical protein